MPQSVLIIGAGIIGASLAFQLSRLGAQVTVLEAGKPANAASGRSFGWINASFYADPVHHRLRVEGIAAHHRLHALLPNAPYQWQGALWYEDQGAGFDRMQQDLSNLCYPNIALDAAQIAAKEPHLAQRPDRALLLPAEGSTDATLLTVALLATSGARLCAGLPAKSLIEKDGKVTGARTAIGPFMADHTILAAGVAAPGLLAPLGLALPMLTRPGQILTTQPVPFRLNHIHVTPTREIRQDSTGRLLAPTATSHQSDSAESVVDPQAQIDSTLTHLRAMFGDPDITLDSAQTGLRPVPGDGLPVVGLAMPGLSLAVMHSGVTLAAVVAEVLAGEVTGQGDHPLLTAYRPGRFQ